MTLRSLLFLFFGCAAVARAYPPAPDYTLYGTVRDERGRVLAKGAAWVIVSNDAGEIVRTPIDLAPEPGHSVFNNLLHGLDGVDESAALSRGACGVIDVTTDVERINHARHAALGFHALRPTVL